MDHVTLTDVLNGEFIAKNDTFFAGLFFFVPAFASICPH